MPDPQDNAKDSGDIRPPGIEEHERSRPAARPEAGGAQDDRALEDEARPGKGENQAGFLKDTEGD